SGVLGDQFTVNGAIQPKLRVLRRKHRFRLLNAGPSRFYQFFLIKNDADQPFKQIGNDESLLEQPEDVKSVLVAVAERADVVIDFQQFNTGDQVYLENRLVMQDDGMGPLFDDNDKMVVLPPGKGDKILLFEVGGDAADPSRLPAKLRSKPALPKAILLPSGDPMSPARLKKLPNHRQFLFDVSKNIFLI